ncbi:MAG: VWA domain-containing protein [Planctomycetota bacterium]
MRAPALPLLLLLGLPLALRAAPDGPDPATAPVSEARRAFEGAVAQQDQAAMRVWIPALARIGTRRAIDPVLDALEVVRQDPRTWRVAREQLTGLQDANAWARVLRVLREGKTVHARLFALEVVERRARAEDDAELLRLLAEKDEVPLRRRAVVALGARPRDAVVAALIAHMRARDADPGAEHQQCAVALERLLGERLDRGEDYQARWKGSLAKWREDQQALARERAAARTKAQTELLPTPDHPWAAAVKEQGAKLYAKPLPEAEVLVQLVAGTKVSVIGKDRATGWWQVRATVAKATLQGFVTPAELAVEVPRPPANAPREGLQSYYGVPLLGKGIVFVFDISGSMAESKLLAGAKRELIRAIRRLPATTRFTIVAFAGGVWPWKQELVSAQKEEQEAAAAWVTKLKSHPDTSLDYALKRALGVPGVDTIVVLTDGYPYRKKHKIAAATILSLVEEANRELQARVSCFGFKGANHELLRSLAAATGGDYRVVGE